MAKLSVCPSWRNFSKAFCSKSFCWPQVSPALSRVQAAKACNPPHLPSQGTKMAKLSISIAQIHQKVWIHMACLLFLVVKPCVGAKTQNFISSSAFFPEKLSSSFTAASSSSFCLCKLPSLKNGHGRNSSFHKIDKHHRPIETLQSARNIMIFRYI